MKKLIISGSSKLHQRALYWMGYFEGCGFEVLDYPTLITDAKDDLEVVPTPGEVNSQILNPGDEGYDEHLANSYRRFWKNLDRADVFFLMNEDQKDTEGYIGAGAIAEIAHVLINNLNHDKKTAIYLLKEPSKEQSCHDEVKFWLDQGWIQIYEPTATKLLLELPEKLLTKTETAEVLPESPSDDTEDSDPTVVASASMEIAPKKHFSLFNFDNRTIDLLTSKKKCLKVLPLSVRQYLRIFCPEFPAWLLNYISAPEMQRLANVSMVGVDYGGIYNFQASNSVLAHSIGVAEIIWHFTHDKKQTLAGLFHDIAAPAFKHAIDYLNGDSEIQESIEADTSKIIRSSRVIMRQLKKDGILPSEVEDYKLYPIADNDIPGLAADRLEYTFSNGYFLYETWGISDVERFYSDITVLENEGGLEELGFKTPALAAEFTERNLPLSANYHSESARATLQFIADVLAMMIDRDLLGREDLYAMTEREVVDWILSCGDQTITEAFRNFQRATTAYASATARKNVYCTDVRSKVRYIVPLVEARNESEPAQRITDLNPQTDDLVAEYVRKKQPKYVGFEFDFRPKH